MRVALLITCLTDSFFPRVGEAVVRVLRHIGCDVAFPLDQTCCGQPAYNSGAADEARRVARRNLRIFERFDHVVCPSASCTAMITQHYAELFRGDEDEPAARRLAAMTREFTCFLRDVLRVKPAALLTLREPTTLHYPCHARGVFEPADLARCLGGASPERLRPPAHAALCCGFGGLFAVDHPAISAGMAEDRLAELSATGAACCASGEAGCTLQLAGAARRAGLPMRFVHPAELIAESLGLMEPPR